MKRAILFGVVLLIVVVLFLPWIHPRHSQRRPSTGPAEVLFPEPRLMLWAWEVPEDLTALDPNKAGVAFLSREVLLSDRMAVRPRMQPLRVARNTYIMAVVRIETAPGFVPTDALVRQTAGAIIDAEQQTHASALQIDFDALASQRKFYADILKMVAERQAPDMPLSITALMSWCRENSWLNTLPINEAVPMLFRMGGPAATRAAAPRSTAGIDQGRCNTSVGIAMDETWPDIASEKRVYVFRSGSWTQDDIANINTLGYQSLRH